MSNKKIRDGVFETNSSSSNSLSIEPWRDGLVVPERLSYVELEMGRTFEHKGYNERFTVLLSLCGSADDVFKLCYKCYQFGVKEIVLPNPDNYTCYGNSDYIHVSAGEIDDSEYELRECLKDDELLKGWLFNPDSEVSGQDDNYLCDW